MITASQMLKMQHAENPGVHHEITDHHRVHHRLRCSNDSVDLLFGAADPLNRLF